jgi:hypothetical protein
LLQKLRKSAPRIAKAEWSKYIRTLCASTATHGHLRHLGVPDVKARRLR